MRYLILSLAILSGCATDNGCNQTFTGTYIMAVREPEPFGVFINDHEQYNVFMSTESLRRLSKGKDYTLCIEYRNGRMYH